MQEHCANIICGDWTARVFTSGHSWAVPKLSIFGERTARGCLTAVKRYAKRSKTMPKGEYRIEFID